MTKAIEGTFDPATGLYTFELEGKAISLPSALATQALAAHIAGPRLLVLVDMLRSRVSVVNSMEEPTIVRFTNVSTSKPVQMRLIIVGVALVQIVESGKVIYQRIECIDGQMSARQVCELAKVKLWSFQESLDGLVGDGFTAETAREILYESGPNWGEVVRTLLWVIQKYTQFKRKELRIVVDGAFRVYELAPKKKIRAVREYLREGADWQVETNNTVMTYLRVLRILVSLDVMPYHEWADSDDAAQPAQIETEPAAPQVAELV